LIILVLAAVVGGVYYARLKPPEQIILTGIVTTDDVIVSAQIQGQVQQLLVREGDIVKKGQLLAVIQPEQWRADMAYYQNTQQGAAAQVTQSEADLRFQESQVNNQIKQADANLAAANADVVAGEADLEIAQLAFQREEEAYKRGAESAQTFDQARTTFEAKKAHLESLRRQAAAADAAVGLAKTNLEQVSVKRAALEMNQRQLAAAEAQKDKAKVQLAYTEIRAPVDGVVDVRASLQGEVVNPAQAIVTLINPDDLWIRADVEETYIDRVHLGDKMTVTLPSGATREGVVFFRGVDADYATQRDVSRTKRDIRTFEIRLRCDNADRALAVGMTAYVALPLAATSQPASTMQ
jgi:HlyD family secretion protein